MSLLCPRGVVFSYGYAMTEEDLALLKARTNMRVELTCVDGQIIVGEVFMVSNDVLLDGLLQPDGSVSYAKALSLQFAEIASVKAVDG